MNTPKKLTTRQEETFRFMADYFWENHQLPSMHVIADHFGFSSDNAAQSLVNQLKKKGLVEHNANGKYRFCRMTDALWVHFDD